MTARHGLFPTDVDSPKQELDTEKGLLAEGGSFEEGDGLRGLFVDGDGLRGLFVEGDDLVDKGDGLFTDGGDGLFTDEGNLLAGEAALLAEGDSLVEEDDDSCAIDSSFSAEKVNRAAESAD